MKVKLRKVKKGSRVYLSTDIFFGYVYNAEGKRVANRERKSLGLNYEVNPKNQFDRKEKKEALRLAEAIILQRETEFQSNKAGLGKSYLAETNFFDFFESHLDKTKMSLNNRKAYQNVISKLIEYRGRYVLINQV
jgi:hypothetical protein